MIHRTAAAIVLCSVACASSKYVPAGPGIYNYRKNGVLHWVKNGQPIDVGHFALSGLDEAMVEVPQAANYARDAQHSWTIATLTLVGAAGLFGTGIVLADSSDDQKQNVGTGLLLGSLALDLLTVLFISHAQTATADALNLYNASAKP